ncbi:Sh3 domain of osteoclast stimulating factor, partial [Caulochytrium protostelioides]
MAALYDYEARTPEELTFAEGAAIVVFDRSDPEWWPALCGDEFGLVPAIYV